MTAVFKTYPTLFGNLKIADDAGPDKLFRPKNKIIPGGVSGKLPNKPGSVAITAGARPANAVSKFTADFAGEYTYAVHALNEYGISEAASPAAPVAVANGQAVTITITHAA